MRNAVLVFYIALSVIFSSFLAKSFDNRSLTGSSAAFLDRLKHKKSKTAPVTQNQPVRRVKAPNPFDDVPKDRQTGNIYSNPHVANPYRTPYRAANQGSGMYGPPRSHNPLVEYPPGFDADSFERKLRESEDRLEKLSFSKPSTGRPELDQLFDEAKAISQQSSVHQMNKAIDKDADYIATHRKAKKSALRKSREGRIKKKVKWDDQLQYVDPRRGY